MAAPATLLKDLAVYAIRRPYLFQGWWCVDLSDGKGCGFETRAAAEKFYRENRRPS